MNPSILNFDTVPVYVTSSSTVEGEIGDEIVVESVHATFDGAVDSALGGNAEGVFRVVGRGRRPVVGDSLRAEIRYGEAVGIANAGEGR